MNKTVLLFSTILIISACQRTNDDWPDKRFERWLSYYDISIHDFKDTGTHEIPYRVEYPFMLTDAELHAGFFVYNPDSSLAIDLDSYHLVLERADDGSLYSPGREVDSEVTLIVFEESMRQRILFCGPSCVFEEAAFHPDGHAAIAGFTENKDGFQPSIWYVDHENHTISLMVSEKKYHPREIRYNYDERLHNIRFWFDPNASYDQLDIPM